jgi:hypothetical protein
MLDKGKPAVHGRDHSPDSADPVYAGVWFYVGAGGRMPDGYLVPDFENSWHNVGGTKVPARFRLTLGPPNTTLTQLKPDGTWALNGLDLVTSQKQLEIQMDVTGGGDGTTVFTLPPSHRLDYDVPMHGHSSTGVYVPCRVYTDGRVVRGIP